MFGVDPFLPAPLAGVDPFFHTDPLILVGGVCMSTKIFILYEI